MRRRTCRCVHRLIVLYAVDTKMRYEFSIFIYVPATPSLSHSLAMCYSHTVDVQRKWKYCVQTIYLICCCCLRALYLQMELQASADLRCLMFMPSIRSSYFCLLNQRYQRVQHGMNVQVEKIWFDCIISIGNENSLNLLPLSMSGPRERLVFIFIYFISFIIFCCAHFAGIPHLCSVSIGILRTCNHGTDIFCCQIHFSVFVFFPNSRRTYTACTHIDYYLFIQMKTIFWRPEPFLCQRRGADSYDSSVRIDREHLSKLGASQANVHWELCETHF